MKIRKNTRHKHIDRKLIYSLQFLDLETWEKKKYTITNVPLTSADPTKLLKKPVCQLTQLHQEVYIL